MRILAHLPVVSFLLIATLAGCPETGPNTSDAGTAADAMPGTGGQGGGAGAGASTGGKPLAAGCAVDSECASGFCVDSVCCNSACDGQCSVCNSTENLGYCTAQIVGDDTTSAQTCTGAHTCAIAIPALNLPACRLKTLQACNTNSDCASLLCETFYLDRDRDGYGDNNTTLKFCEVEGATPPTGYVAQGGDCCDTDSNAFPGQSAYFHTVDACGGWDYDCSGTIDGEEGVFKFSDVNSSGCGVTTRGATLLCH